jgi:hypothetical protein
MARTIAEIKESMTADFMRNADLARAYGFETGAAFSSHFSKVSIESLLFYIVACAMWVLESMFDKHKVDVERRIEEILPHRPKWYRDRMLAFMKDKPLVTDTDYYDTGGMSDDQIEAARVVKYAAVTESTDASLLTIKVATDAGGVRGPLDADTEMQLRAYIAEVKDAGVRVNLVNQTPDVFDCEVDVYYDAVLLPQAVSAACLERIKNYIENLSFNGEYSNMSLVDELQGIEGVRIVEMCAAVAHISGESTPTAINARFTPAAGYFSAGDIIVNMKSY